MLLSMESRSGQTVVNQDGSITFESEVYECFGQWVMGKFVPSAAVPGEEVRVHTLPWKPWQFNSAVVDQSVRV